MYELYSSLKPFYEKFLQRGKLYGLSPHEIHEMALNLFIKFLSVVILLQWNFTNNNNSKMNLITNYRKIRMSVHKILFQKEINETQLFLDTRLVVPYNLIELSHLEIQFKDSLSFDEWDELVKLLLTQQWTLEEDYKNNTNNENKVSPIFLSFFYENVLNDFENFFSLSPKISKRKHRGVFYTPWHIIREITDKCLDRYESQHPHLFREKNSKIKILDPCCGTGSFLIYAADSLLHRITKNIDTSPDLPMLIIERCIYGIDLSQSSLTVAKIRLLFWILNLCHNNINSIPPWIFDNICTGNSLFGLCKESVQYPLDYIITLSRINDYLEPKTREKQKKDLDIENNWLITSLNTKEAKKKKNLSTSSFNGIRSAEKELSLLVDTFYYNWLRNSISKYPRPVPIKKGGLNAITPFHWGEKFPEAIINGGFDLVIGNPPYGRSILSRDEKSLLKIVYKVCSSKNAKKYSLNAASAFIERSIILLKTDGILGLIIPFSILRVEEFETLRKLILETTMIWNINDESAAFADVTLEMCSIFLAKRRRTDYEVSITPRPKIHVESSVPISIFRKYSRFMIYYDDLWEKVTSQGLVFDGVVSGDYGIDHRIVKKDLELRISSKYPIRFLHSGRSVNQFALNPKYFQWSKPHPNNDRFTTYFKEARLVNTAIGNRFRVAYKPARIVPGTNVSILEIENPSFHFFPMLILLNSDLISYILKRYVLNFSHLTVYLHKYYTKLIPIKYPHEFEQEFKTIASYLIFLIQGHLCGKLEEKTLEKRTNYLLNLSNYLVYDLYFPEILGISSNLAVSIGKFLKPIEIESFLDLVLFPEDNNDSDRLLRIISTNWKTIRHVTHKLRDSDEIRQHKKTIFNHKIVRTIRKHL